jgi:hypothetical protein
MSDKLYDNIVSRLKSVKPVPDKPEELTDRIMQLIGEPAGLHRTSMTIRATRKQWLFIRSFRIVSTAAAIFLIFFFILEQKEMNLKIEKLQAQVAREPEYSSYMNIRVDYNDLNPELIAIPPDTLRNLILINRSSLNFMLQRIHELENENKTLKDKFLDIYEISQ